MLTYPTSPGQGAGHPTRLADLLLLQYAVPFRKLALYAVRVLSGSIDPFLSHGLSQSLAFRRCTSTYWLEEDTDLV